MSTYRQSIPQADTLMGSMRSMGYSFEAAIADIIDNSISANCSVVKLFFPSEPTEDLVVGILDDGEGMSADVLFEAMRYGSTDSELERNANDLGRFGLGMKSASLSQCRILTVVSLQEEKISSYSWDYNYIQNRKEWVAKNFLDSFKSVRCVEITPLLSHIMMFSFFAPNIIYNFVQEMEAAPAPFTTIFTSSIFFPAISSALIKPAPEIMAVPCWSSCMTGISSSSFRRRSISKHSGALMSSRLIPPKVGAIAFTAAMNFSGSFSSTSMSKTSMPA